MKHEIDVLWGNNMYFESDIDGHKVAVDATPEVGGEDKAPRPKKLMLMALAGCTGMDVISILAKMRIVPTYFNMKIEGEITEDHPKYYKSMHIIYEFRGDQLPLEKLQKAVDLSAEKYCGVQALYKLAIPVTNEIKILE